MALANVEHEQENRPAGEKESPESAWIAKVKSSLELHINKKISVISGAGNRLEGTLSSVDDLTSKDPCLRLETGILAFLLASSSKFRC